MSSVQISLRRPDPSHPWGFRIAGGRDFGCSVSVRKVGPNSLAGRHGLQIGDVLLSIGGDATMRMTHQQAQQAIIRCGNELDLEVVRGPLPPAPAWPATSPVGTVGSSPWVANSAAAAAAVTNASQPSPGIYRSNRGIQLRPSYAPEPAPAPVPSYAPLQINAGGGGGPGAPAPWARASYASSSSLDSPRSGPLSPQAVAPRPQPPPQQPSAMHRLDKAMSQPGRPLPPGFNPRAPPAGAGTRRGQSQRHQAGSRGPMDRDPICDACHNLVRGPFIVALDRCFCPEHFRCSQCGIRMENCGFVEEGGQLFCETDYARYLAPRCARCGVPVVERVVNALNKAWHPACFCCHACKRQLASSEPGPGEATFRLGDDNQPYCDEDWSRLFQSRCDGCGYPIDEMDQFIDVKGKIYHSACFCCAACRVSLDGKPFVSREGKAFCKAHARAAAIF